MKVAEFGHVDMSGYSLEKRVVKVVEALAPLYVMHAFALKLYMYYYIIVMDYNNLRHLSYIIGEDTDHKVYKMMYFVGENRDVKDPLYTDNFDETYADIEKACRALLAKLIKEYSLA